VIIAVIIFIAVLLCGTALIGLAWHHRKLNQEKHEIVSIRLSTMLGGLPNSPHAQLSGGRASAGMIAVHARDLPRSHFKEKSLNSVSIASMALPEEDDGQDHDQYQGQGGFVDVHGQQQQKQQSQLPPRAPLATQFGGMN
jgi:hypothetical protein